MAQLAVVIPTLNTADTLRGTLEALQGELAAAGVEAAYVVADGGSTDGTGAAAEAAGATVVPAPRGRGVQLAAGAAAAEAPWLLFWHADTGPGRGWGAAVRGFLAAGAAPWRAGYFRLSLADDAPAARRVEAGVAWRARVLGLPYGDQGLILPRAFYEALGGYPAQPLLEDVALVRRIGRQRLVALEAPAVTSAARYRRDGYSRRVTRNVLCLGLYFLGVPPAAIRRLYE